MMHNSLSNGPGSRDRLDHRQQSRPLALETVVPFERDDPAGSAVRSTLETAVTRIVASAPDSRRGDKDAIHRVRTSIRRLRSELRAFKELVDGPWRERLEVELKWLAGLLGGVRNLDILMDRLRKYARKQEQRDSSAFALAPFFPAIQARRTDVAQALNNALDGDRYRSLLDTLRGAAEHPPLLDPARLSCRTVLPSAAAAAWRRLKKVARRLRPSDPVETFHELRKRAKRVRYTAELAAPVLRRREIRAAHRFIRLTTRIQDLLGEHQDAIDTTREIEEVLAQHADAPAFLQAAESLLNSQRKSAGSARNDFFELWDKLDRKKLRRWMKKQTGSKTKAGREPSAGQVAAPVRSASSANPRALRHTATLSARPR
jgi:CHAD domain-containing protein